MKRVMMAVALLAVSVMGVATEFQVYPGAAAEDFAAWLEQHPDVKAPPGVHVERYTTPDPLDKVVAFYAAKGKEAGPEKVLKLTTGEQVRMRTIILDGAEDMAVSKLFVRIQRPDFEYITPQLRGEGMKDWTAIEVISRD